MTLELLRNLVATYATVNKYKLAEGRLEVDARIVGDSVLLEVGTFPDDHGHRKAAERRMTLAEVQRDPAFRDPEAGPYPYVAGVIGDAIKELGGGHHRAVQGAEGQGGLQGGQPQRPKVK